MNAIEQCERFTVDISCTVGPDKHVPGWRQGDLVAALVHEAGVWGIVNIRSKRFCFGGAAFLSCEDACGALVELNAAGITPDNLSSDNAKQAAAIISKFDGMVLAMTPNKDGEAWIAKARALRAKP